MNSPRQTNENNQISQSNNKIVMVFKIASDKFTELTNFVDCDQNSLTVFSPIEQVSSGAVFQEKSVLETLFEEFENAS